MGGKASKAQFLGDAHEIDFKESTAQGIKGKLTSLANNGEVGYVGGSVMNWQAFKGYMKAKAFKDKIWGITTGTVVPTDCWYATVDNVKDIETQLIEYGNERNVLPFNVQNDSNCAADKGYIYILF